MVGGWKTYSGLIKHTTESTSSLFVVVIRGMIRIFRELLHHTSDVTPWISINGDPPAEHRPWKVTLVDTGESTQTGGRLTSQVRMTPFVSPMATVSVM